MFSALAVNANHHPLFVKTKPIRRYDSPPTVRENLSHHECDSPPHIAQGAADSKKHMKKRLAITGSGVTVIVALILIILAAVGTFSASGSSSSLVWLPLGDSITFGCEMLLLTAAAHCCSLLLTAVLCCSLPCSVAHCCSLLLLIAAHCCSLLLTAVLCCSLLLSHTAAVACCCPMLLTAAALLHQQL